MDDFDARFSAAKSDRSGRVEDDGYEVYKFCFNGREDEWRGRNNRQREPEEIFADVVAGVAEDFFGDLFHTMTPENAPWVEYETGAGVPEEIQEQVTEFMEVREVGIAKAIKQSNYYDEGPTAFQDAVMGNVCMWIDRHSLSEPVTCEAVPLSECYFRLGPYGIDDRFRESKYFYRDLPKLLPDAKFDRMIDDKIKNSPKAQGKVTWGFWRDYTDPGNPVWMQNIRVDGKPVGLDMKKEGDGSIPMVVGRFNAQPKTPWGWGPGRRMLPTMRTLDELVRMNLEAMDHTLDPAVVYPSDGVLDLSEGVEAGVAYPSMPGSGDSIQTIGGGQLDYGWFAEEKIEERIRDGFYRDLPQKGKTPPSASQYMGEEQKQIRRMARPAGKLWKEFGVGLLKRFEWLETQPGGVFDGEDFQMLDGQLVILRPISPLERAQAREEVLVSQSLMQMTVEALGPEQAAMVMDGQATMNNIKDKLKDTLVVYRTAEELKQMAEAAMQMQQGPQGAPDAPQ
tara:strand:- start:35014 stop:36537 length:1524 start_codon:yes stop_codon:yes gene_type:complete